jgi:hypothetical protein
VCGQETACDEEDIARAGPHSQRKLVVIILFLSWTILPFLLALTGSKVKVNGNFTLDEAMSAQMGSRGLAVRFS